MILIKHNITLLREILLLRKINDFFIRSLIIERRENKDFKLYNYNGVNITCCGTRIESYRFKNLEDSYICFDMGNYDVKISLGKQQIAITGNYKKVFNEKIIDGIIKYDKVDKDEKISILCELKREIKKIKEV